LGSTVKLFSQENSILKEAPILAEFKACLLKKKN